MVHWVVKVRVLRSALCTSVFTCHSGPVRVRAVVVSVLGLCRVGVQVVVCYPLFSATWVSYATKSVSLPNRDSDFLGRSLGPLSQNFLFSFVRCFSLCFLLYNILRYRYFTGPRRLAVSTSADTPPRPVFRRRRRSTTFTSCPPLPTC